jgi:CRISPR-associated endonuclease/helicase Cas3
MRKPTNITLNHSNIEQPLSIANCLAKTWRTPEGIKAGRSVLDHCLIVGNVAETMLRRIPQWLRDSLFPEGTPLIVACHDIGKICPTFQKKLYSALSSTASTNAILGQINSCDAMIEIQWGGHGGISQATLQDLLGEDTYVPYIAGKHHGYTTNLQGLPANCNVFGGEAWQKQREIFVEILKTELKQEFPVISREWQANALAGLTSVADWIGSGQWFENPEQEWQPLIEQAVDEAGYLLPIFNPNLSFTEIFGFSAKEAQNTLINCVTHQGVYILEAPMGLGKTEAALYAAYQMLQKNQATGIYFALPTQLTSDKIHERMSAFLEKILNEDSPHRQALLLHGNAMIHQLEMGEDGAPGGSWFSHGKRGILAPFAVGTIDQALMSVMNVKHGFVRAFGLAGKVVILDEIHSYDSFTGTVLNELLEMLRHLHCTVILLSATLTSERRAELLKTPVTENAYPLITAHTENNHLIEKSVINLPDHEALIHLTTKELALQEALKRAEEGQQVLWIENTVQEAQLLYALCAARMASSKIECGLLHSRFTRHDRAINEREWIRIYGKDGAVLRQTKGRLLIGTQVLEQSIDIDADFLITRMAPTDMLLQRIGRLWRHETTPRPPNSGREAWIIAPSLAAAKEQPEAEFGLTAKIYAPYILCRSLEIWQSLTTLSLPKDIRSLMEATYRSREETGAMAKYLHLLNKKREELQNHARIGLSCGGKTLPEERAQTRYSEVESTEVLLFHSYRQDSAQRRVIIELLDGETLSFPMNGRALPRSEWRAIAAKLRQNFVSVTEHQAPLTCQRKDIEWLRDYCYLGNPADEETQLRIGLVAEDGQIFTPHHTQANPRYELRYDSRLGYQAHKLQEKP